MKFYTLHNSTNIIFKNYYFFIILNSVYTFILFLADFIKSPSTRNFDRIPKGILYTFLYFSIIKNYFFDALFRNQKIVLQKAKIQKFQFLKQRATR